MKLYLDIETRSRVDLKTAGARRYAADPSTQITTASWRFQGANRNKLACNIKGLEHLGRNPMSEFVHDLNQATHIVAHNINFDANVIFSTLGPCGLTLEKLDCTMARAQRLSLPGGLDELCTALGLPGKDPNGYRLMMATCKPKRDGSWCEDPEVYRPYLDYNDRDVDCLVSVDQLLAPLPPAELEIWRRTWRKNTSGLPLDLELLQRIAARRAEIELEIAGELRELTGGGVTAVTQRARILEWVRGKGAQLPDTKRSTLEEWLESVDLPYDVWRVLTIMFESGGSAPTKAQALLDRHVQGYFQDATRFFGARSGRGTSEGVNTFNIARPSGLYDAEQVIQQLKAEGLSPTGRVFNNTQLSDVLRGTIVAAPDTLLLDADLSNIELRFSLWFAGDHKKLALLRDDKDLYASTAGEAMGIPGLTKKTHPKERQAYKKVVLSGGYAIGVLRLFNAFKTDKDLPYEYRRDLTYAQVAAIHSGYRDANVPLQMCWKELDQAARATLAYRNTNIPACGGKVNFRYDSQRDILDLTLPSGRSIPHYRPHIDAEGQFIFCRAKYGRMLPQRAFGGGWLELICQASARDVITGVEAAIEAELPDVRLLLDIYDSVVALAPKAVAEQRLEQILNIMRRVPVWAHGLPLNGEGYVAERMMK